MKQTDERTLVSFDWAMKNILREKANFDVLEGFLSTLLGEEIQVKSLLESEANQQHELDKFNRVDLLAVDSKEKILVIEMQYTWQAAYLRRWLYSTSKLVVENMELGKPYENVRKVISISILYFPFTIEVEGNDDYLYYGKTEFYGVNTGNRLEIDMAKLPKVDKNAVSDKKEGKDKADKASEETPDKPEKPTNIFPEYYLIEVEHFQNIIKQPIDEWVYLFKNSEVRKEFQSKNIQAARQKLQLLHMNAEERAAYEQFQMSRASALDVLAGQFKEGMEQGIEIGKGQGLEIGKGQGIEIGKNEAQRENVRRMRSKGYDLTEIMEITGLSEAEIRFL